MQTKSQLKVKLEAFFDEVSDAKVDFFNSEGDPDILKDQGIKIKYVDSYGGEDQGSEYWSVYLFSDDNEEVFIKFDGSYSSYCGSEFDEWYYVKPKPVQVIQYFKED